MNIIESLSNEMLLPTPVITRLVSSAPHRYKVYEIPKKSGNGTRTIAQPARSVKAMQYWVMKNMLDDFPVHVSAMAYRTGTNIKMNADVHAPQRFLMKLDFANFFTSFTSDDFERYLAKNEFSGLSQQDLTALKNILFWNRLRQGRLVMSIGAPSSPVLSNILMYEFDQRVSELSIGADVKYTRYADDLTLSTNLPNVLRSVKLRIEAICAEMSHPKLLLNERKTVHASRAKSRNVTGLILSNDGVVTLGRDRKRLIRSSIHRFSAGILDVEAARQLRGTLAFVKMAEPDFLERLTQRYGDATISAIFRSPE